MWQDGPLVQAMRAGHLFLVDEISLANDSVLERLNSVLEPERTLVGRLWLRLFVFAYTYRTGIISSIGTDDGLF